MREIQKEQSISCQLSFIDERSEIATEPAVRRLRGHDRAREETKGLIPPSERGNERFNTPQLCGGCRALEL